MSNLLILHNEAMDLALLGDKALKTGDKASALSYYEQSYKKEVKAVEIAQANDNPEPGLSILYRSAASLAFQCGKLREAEKLIARALSGNPTNEIAGE